MTQTRTSFVFLVVVLPPSCKVNNTHNTITYDQIGNPLSYHNGSAYNFTWQNGRQLASLTTGGVTSTYKYNESGIRTQKTVNGVVTNYYLNGSTILRQEKPGETIDFQYNESGNVYGMVYNGTQYYYVRNGQGDIIGILDSNGTQVVSYVYDSWGKLVSYTGGTIAAANPFRYRGYYYDIESDLYYCQSRYYDPEVGRFINADGLVQTPTGLTRTNMFAYCNNNPVNCLRRYNKKRVMTATND